MHIDEKKPKMNVLRTLFLQGGNGRFEFLKQLFTPAELLSEKPSVLLAQVYVQLRLQKSDFNARSFDKWLLRLRKKNKLIDTPKALPYVSAAPRNPTEKADKAAFPFSDPATMKRKEEPLIQIVTSQNQHT